MVEFPCIGKIQIIITVEERRNESKENASLRSPCSFSRIFVSGGVTGVGQVLAKSGSTVSGNSVSEEEKERYRKEAERIREEELQKQREEEALAKQKEAEQLTTDFEAQITKAITQANNDGTAVAVIKTDYFTCFTQKMWDMIAAHPEVSYEVHYKYQGKHYVFTIPAGTDISGFENSNGYYGFRFCSSIFGGYEEQ